MQECSITKFCQHCRDKLKLVKKHVNFDFSMESGKNKISRYINKNRIIKELCLLYRKKGKEKIKYLGQLSPK